MFRSSHNRNVDKRCLRNTKDQWLSTMLKRFDSDKDGRLSKEDVGNAFRAIGLSPPDDQTFASLSDVDENGNRYIGGDEKIRGLVKYVKKRIKF
ncbi:hypothetical protein PTKIN_Ptkin08bG0013900 [Pterospermum kingtungense]